MDVYQEYKTIYEKEMTEMLKNFTEEGIEKSNLEKFIDYALEMGQNLHQMWVSGDYDDNQRLQQLVFPGGIRYNRQNGHYRTEKMNLTFAAIADQIRVLDKKEGEKSIANFDFSPSVAPSGIEPLSKVPETFVLSIKLRGQKLPGRKIALKFGIPKIRREKSSTKAVVERQNGN